MFLLSITSWLSEQEKKCSHLNMCYYKKPGKSRKYIMTGTPLLAHTLARDLLGLTDPRAATTCIVLRRSVRTQGYLRVAKGCDRNPLYWSNNPVQSSLGIPDPADDVHCLCLFILIRV